MLHSFTAEPTRRSALARQLRRRHVSVSPRLLSRTEPNSELADGRTIPDLGPVPKRWSVMHPSWSVVLRCLVLAEQAALSRSGSCDHPWVEAPLQIG